MRTLSWQTPRRTWPLRGLRFGLASTTPCSRFTLLTACSTRCAPNLPCPIRCGNRIELRHGDARDWYRTPADLFDNLYFVGTQNAGVYAVNTSEGIILIDTGFHYNSEELVLGLLKFGVDPDNLRYIVVSHGHDDRYFGANALQKRILQPALSCLKPTGLSWRAITIQTISNRPKIWSLPMASN